MFKVGDKVVPKLDSWKEIQASYKKYYKVDLPEDPFVLVVYKTPSGECCCQSLQKINEICGYLYVTIHQDNLLKAP